VNADQDALIPESDSERKARLFQAQRSHLEANLERAQDAVLRAKVKLNDAQILLDDLEELAALSGSYATAAGAPAPGEVPGSAIVPDPALVGAPLAGRPAMIVSMAQASAADEDEGRLAAGDGADEGALDPELE
jgi:hypothetical protein